MYFAIFRSEFVDVCVAARERFLSVRLVYSTVLISTGVKKLSSLISCSPSKVKVKATYSTYCLSIVSYVSSAQIPLTCHQP